MNASPVLSRPPSDPRVLLVDDLPENLFALSQILKREPYAVDAAESAEQALRMMLDHDYACVICDIQMPGIDGLELIRIVREDPDLKNVPFTFLTAHGHDARITEEAFRYDAFDFLTKPVDPAVVRSKVRIFAQLHAQRQRLTEQSAQLQRDRQALEGLNRQLARSNESLEQYAYLASHDLRGPLRKMTVLCEMLQEDHAEQLDASGVACVETIVDHAKQMRRIVDDLLRLARIDTDTIEWSRCDLGEILTEVRAGLADEAQAAGVRIHVDSLPEVRSDVGWLLQLFTNLVSNAIRYHGDLNPFVRVTADVLPDCVAVHIQDNGVGIAEADQRSIFEPFRSLKRRKDSQGLGLAIAQRIATRLGATLSLVSAPGEGSTFTVALPT